MTTMRKINKGQEPREWTEYRLTPGVDYQAIPELRDSLLKEQGYICAYCMRHIPVRDTNSDETSRIEHILSRENHDDLKLDYSNMVICCPGAIDRKFHCDKLKESNDITFDLFSDHFISTLSYSSKSGEIKCSNSVHSTEIKNILNLNNGLLKKNRAKTLKGVIDILERIGWTKANITKQYNIWNTTNSQGAFNEYCGIVTWYLEKKLRQCAK